MVSLNIGKEKLFFVQEFKIIKNCKIKATKTQETINIGILTYKNVKTESALTPTNRTKTLKKFQFSIGPFKNELILTFTTKNQLFTK